MNPNRSPERWNSLSDPSLRLGILDLPIETLTRIIASYDSITDNRLWNLQPAIQDNLRSRSKTIRALCQTCRSLRAVFLPICWERLDWCFKSEPQEGKWYEELAAATQKRAIGLLNRPDLAVYVRTVNLSLTGCSAHLVFPDLAKCLASLPYLHTINIVDSTLVGMPSLLREAFHNIKLPSVRKMTLPMLAVNVLKTCPNVRKIVCTDIPSDGSKYLGALTRNCKRVEYMVDFLPTEPIMKRLVRCVANLRSFTFSREVPSAVIQHLARLTQLEAIEFIWHISPAAVPDTRQSEFDRCVAVARDVLAHSNSFKPNKVVRLIKRRTISHIDDKGLEYWTIEETVDVFDVAEEDHE